MQTFHHLGFQRVYGAPEDPNLELMAGDRETWARLQMRRDDAALAEAEKDMNGWIDHDQRYMAIYTPKVSHGPWADIVDGGNEKDVIRRGRNLAIHVDRALGELVALLRKKGRLEHTLIVVTADHGLRTWAETPKGLAMLTDEYAFGVPFLLYAPGILKQAQRIPYLTSHIDVQPSLLDLIGVSAGREREQGMPLWDERIASRHTYFWANQYLGSDAMVADERFHLWNRGAKIAYSGPRMHFDEEDGVRDDSAEERKAIEEMARMDAIRIAWFRTR
jgi:membrane-anchored protein YejM (alkaline phosphatase superfamily)